MYDPADMNKLLLSRFPELKEDFEKETAWNEGIETGSYVVYEDVFMPFIIKSFAEKNKDDILRIMNFVEEMASSEDFEKRNLIGVTIIDNIRMYNIEDDFILHMGPCTKKMYEDLS